MSCNQSIESTNHRETLELVQTLLAQQTELLERVMKLAEAVERGQQDWYSVQNAAARTGLSAKHIWRAIVGGTLPASNVGTHDRALYRVSREDLNTWMEKRKAGAAAPLRRNKLAPVQAPVSRHHVRAAA